jgi:glycosyltransferase involved in cell wall biosynthesis
VDRFHAITQAVKDAAVRDLGIDPDKVTVVARSRNRQRLGEPSPERRSAVRGRLGLPEDAFVVLNVGRQEYQKGQRYLLEAMPSLLRLFPGTVALIVGKEGNQTPELVELHGKLALGDAVRFLGHRDDVADLMNAADTFVLPSLYEGLAGVLIEAMAMGLPIVASRLDAVSEVVVESGNAILVPAGNPEELAEGLALLALDADRRLSYGRMSKRIFDARFRSEMNERRMAGFFIGALAQ